MMLHPEEIRQSILQEQMPDSWHIIRGSASSAFFFALLVFWEAYIVVQALLITIGLFITLTISPVTIDRFISFWPVLLIGNLVALIFSLSIAYIETRRAKDTIITFLPEGCIEFTSVSSNKPTKSTCQVIWYDRTVAMRLHINIWGNIYLKIRTHDDIEYQWFIKPYYHDRAAIAQNAIITYHTYTMLQDNAVDGRMDE